MNLNHTGRKSLQIESKQSEITLSATNGGINIQITQAESFVDILNELKKMGQRFVPKGQDLTRFDQLVGKISALHNDDVKKSGFEKKPANEFSKLDTFDPIRKSTINRQIEDGHRQRFSRNGRKSSQRGFPLSLRKKDINPQFAEEYLLTSQNTTRQNGKYHKFTPTLVPKIPKQNKK